MYLLAYTQASYSFFAGDPTESNSCRGDAIIPVLKRTPKRTGVSAERRISVNGRISAVSGRSSEGALTDPTADARARRVGTGQNAPLLLLKTRPFSLDSSGENRRNWSFRRH